MVKERLDLEISETYVDAPVKIGLLPSFLIYLIGAIGLLKLLSKMTGGEVGILPMFSLIFLMALLAPVLYNRKKSIFEKTREPLKTVTGGGSIGLLQGTVPFFKLLIYHDAIEVRFFFHSYLIPYNKMEKAPDVVGTLFRGLSIRSNLPGVPKKIVFVELGSGDIAAIIESYRIKQHDTHERRAGESEDGISNIIVDESRRQKRIMSQIKTLAIKMVFMVILAEIIAISAFGIIYSNLMLMNNKNKQNVKIFKNREYQSISDRAPEKFETVIVEYDSVGVVKKETFISMLGDTMTISYKNGTTDGKSWTSYSNNSNIVMFAFPVLGMLLMILSDLLGATLLRKRGDSDSEELTFANKLQICGMIMFFSFFITAPIKMYLVDFLIWGY